ncbi:hypothetical protein [Shewanella sp. BC20]|uniref:hypothetical protein n=1 Tax=Shewanella sp. BC20 TaxID=2004459 RepID=UPI0011B24CC0|nr:hypothetical protein [Shewanella sp. BC20]
MHYDFCDEKVEEWGLSRLATRFKNICKNNDLSSKIKSVCKTRNQLAHDAFFQSFRDKINGINNEELHTKGCKIYSKSVEVSQIITELLRELKVLEQEYEQLTKQSR